MPDFKYKAKKGPTEIVEGVIDAANRDHAVRKIVELGLFPFDVHNAAESAALPVDGKSGGLSGLKLGWSRISGKQITFFTRQLATLMRSQIPILQTLALLRDQSLQPKFRALLASLYNEIEDGKPLSESLQKFPRQFSPMYLAMVQAGELSGRLEEILQQLSLFREKDAEFRKKIKAAMAYPLFLLIVGTASVGILMTFVLPRLLKLFTEMRVTLPAPTRILMHVSDFCAATWGGTAIGIVLFILFAIYHDGFRKVLTQSLDRLKLRLPILKPLTQNIEIERFTRTLSLLIKSGIPIVSAVNSAALTLENEEIRREFDPVSQRLAQGQRLSEALSRIKFFPTLCCQMVAIGEEGGRLQEILDEIANQYSGEIEDSTRIITSLLEPILILVMGLVIGFIAAGMLLPIFEFQVGAE